MKQFDKDLQYIIHVANLKAVIKYVPVFTALFVLFGSLRAQGIQDNLTVLNRMYGTVIDSLTKEMAEPRLIIPLKKGESVTFLRAGWIDYWTNADRKDLKDTTSHQLNIENFNVKIEYRENGIGLLGLNRFIERRIHLTLKGWIESMDQKQLDTAFNLHKIRQDTISAADLSDLEKSPYSFCRGSFQSRSAWTNFIEPALVIISVGVSIYLFFSVRS